MKLLSEDDKAVDSVVKSQDYTTDACGIGIKTAELERTILQYHKRVALSLSAR
jgi:hypothetical protein